MIKSDIFSVEWEEHKICEMCELINAERIPFHWIVITVDSEKCECCKGK